MNKESSPKNFESKKPNYHLRRAATVGALGLALFGAEQAVESGLDAFRHDKPVVEDYMVSLQSGDTVTSMVSNALNDIAESNNIDRGELNGTSEAQAAASEMKSKTGEAYNQPGETYEINISENNFGDKEVSVEPSIDPTS